MNSRILRMILLLVAVSVGSLLLGMFLQKWLSGKNSQSLLGECAPCDCDQENFVSDTGKSIDRFLGGNIERINSDDISEVIRATLPKIADMTQSTLNCLNKNIGLKEKRIIKDFWIRMSDQNKSMVNERENEQTLSDWTQTIISVLSENPTTRGTLESCGFFKLTYILILFFVLRGASTIRLNSMDDFWRCISQITAEQFSAILRERRDIRRVSEILGCSDINIQ